MQFMNKRRNKESSGFVHCPIKENQSNSIPKRKPGSMVSNDAYYFLSSPISPFSSLSFSLPCAFLFLSYSSQSFCDSTIQVLVITGDHFLKTISSKRSILRVAQLGPPCGQIFTALYRFLILLLFTRIWQKERKTRAISLHLPE